MIRCWNNLSDAERLTIVFEKYFGCLGIAELVRCLNQDDYGVKVEFFRVREISAEYQGFKINEPEFSYQRFPRQPLRQFIHMANLFPEYSFAERKIIDGVCLEIALALNGKGERRLFQSFEASFG